jgi:GDP-L-fucose synthase
MAFYDGKTVVICGGNGFLGSHIKRKLSEFPCKVYSPSLRNGIDFRRFDVCLSCFKELSPNIVVNCAGDQGGIGYYQNREGAVYFDNLLMGAYLLEAARLCGVSKFVNIISNCVYPGYLDKDLLSEEDLWTGPLHESVLSYGSARKVQIAQGQSYAKQYNFDSIPLILTNMYGPGDHLDPQKSHALGGLLLRTFEAKRNSLPNVEIWGTGESVREWLYVEDAALAIILAAEKYDDPTPMNIAVGTGITIRELAFKIKRAVGFQGELIFDDRKPSGTNKKVLAASKARARLGWNPQVSIDQGIKNTVDWLELNYDNVHGSKK